MFSKILWLIPTNNLYCTHISGKIIDMQKVKCRKLLTTTAVAEFSFYIYWRMSKDNNNSNKNNNCNVIYMHTPVCTCYVPGNRNFFSQPFFFAKFTCCVVLLPWLMQLKMLLRLIVWKWQWQDMAWHATCITPPAVMLPACRSTAGLLKTFALQYFSKWSHFV